MDYIIADPEKPFPKKTGTDTLFKYLYFSLVQGETLQRILPNPANFSHTHVIITCKKPHYVCNLKLHTMKTQISFGKISLPLFFFFLLAVSCKKNDIVKPVPIDNLPQVSKAQFAAAEIELEEGFKSHTVEILLSPKASMAGTVTVKLEDLDGAIYQRDYVTLPETENGKIILAVEPGAEKVTFRFMSADDDLHNPARSVKITLEQDASALIKPEGRTSIIMNILDNEQYSKIGFTTERSSVSENEQAGIDVTLDIAPGARGNGYVDIEINPADLLYGQHFTTVPAAVNGKIRLMVSQGDQNAKFKVSPVNGYGQHSYKIIEFKIAESTENLKGFGNLEHELFVLENRENNRLTLKSIRENFTGREMVYLFPVTISGRVVSKNDNVLPNVVYIEDETGGIAVEFTGNNSIPMGQLITIAIEGGILTEKNDVLTIRNISNDQAQSQGFDIHVVPVFTLHELGQKQDAMEGKMITLKHVTFATSNQGNTLEGDVDITDGQYSAKVRTESFATFKNNVIPPGIRAVTGVLLWTRDGYILLPQGASDIR